MSRIVYGTDQGTELKKTASKKFGKSQSPSSSGGRKSPIFAYNSESRALGLAQNFNNDFHAVWRVGSCINQCVDTEKGAQRW